MTEHHAAIIISSDRAHAGTYEDKSGPAARAWLEAHGFAVKGLDVVPDEPTALRETIGSFVERGVDVLVISGGTGLSPRDVTPQVLDQVCDFHIPGFGEMLRQGSLKYSPNAYLSRCGGWVKGGTLVLALPGNPKAVTEQLDILGDLLPHALKNIRGECKHRHRNDA